MSSKFGEIIKKLIFVFGEKPTRGLTKLPPTQPRRISTKFTRRENAISGRGCGIHTRNWDAEKREGGRKIMQNFITQQRKKKKYFDAILHTKIGIPFLLLIALTNCAHLLLAPLASKKRILYSKSRVYKRMPELAASPQSTALHSTGNTSVKASVTRMKSATATHVE